MQMESDFGQEPSKNYIRKQGFRRFGGDWVGLGLRSDEVLLLRLRCRA